MADIIIAAMEQRHVGEVAAIEEKCFSMPWSAAAFADAADSQNYEYIVALDGVTDSVVAYAGMQVVMDEAEITNIAVYETYRFRAYPGLFHGNLRSFTAVYQKLAAVIPQSQRSKPSSGKRHHSTCS